MYGFTLRLFFDGMAHIKTNDLNVDQLLQIK